MKKYAIGIDIGGTRTKFGLVDLAAGQVLDTLILPTETREARLFEAMIGTSIKRFEAKTLENQAQLVGIGIGVPSFVFADGLVDSTYGFMDFMEDYPLVATVETAFGLPCRTDNDARLVALGEAIYGQGKGFERVLVLTLGTGLGVGFVNNQKLQDKSPFGHMAGHITVTQNDVKCYCGKTGCLEALVSASGIVAAAKRLNWEEKYPQLPLSSQAVFEANNAENNPEARQIVADVVHFLKIGIDNYINIYAPDIIVLGGGVAKGLGSQLPYFYDASLLRPFKNYQTQIAISALEEQSGILGSAALFRETPQ